MQAVVRADWEAQEKRLSRLPHSPEAIESALRRTQALLADLQHREIADLSVDAAELQRLAERVCEAGSLAEANGGSCMTRSVRCAELLPSRIRW